MQLDSAVKLNPALLGKPALDPKHMDMSRIEESAKEFEAMFMTEMLRPMFEDLKPNEMFGGGKGEEIFQSMMLDEYGKNMAATGTLGIADLVKQQLIEMQSKQNEPDMAQNMHNPSEGPTIQMAATGENDV